MSKKYLFRTPRIAASLPTSRLTVTHLEDRTTPTAAVALSGTNLLSFDTATPATISATTPITGLAANDTLVGIDYRPQNGTLYGLAQNSTTGGLQLYGVSARTGVAAAIGTTGNLVDTTGAAIAIPVGTNFGFDFNPVADRIRVVTSNGLNIRINPNTGSFVDFNTTAAGIQPDGSTNGATTVLDATAYTNNAPNVTATTQYTLDSVSDKLFIQNPPNNGTQVGALSVTLNGATLDFTSVNGFDIPGGVNAAKSGDPVTGKAFAGLTVGGVSSLYAIELSTGVATLVGAIGAGTAPINGLAVNPLDGIVGTPLVGIAGANLVRFNSATPGTVVTPIPIGGLSATESLVAIDIRPATGQYIGLVQDSAAATLRTVIVDPQNASTTALGTGLNYVDATGAAITFPAGTNFGLDFNPTVDRIRLVTSTGFNGRINPNDGTAVDGNLGGAAGSVAGVNPDKSVNSGDAAVTLTSLEGTAYTNSFNGTKVTTQYGIDSVSNRIAIQNPPNAGTQVNSVVITLGGQPLDFTGVNGFEIPSSVQVATSNAPASGFALAGLTVGGVSSLYSINLTTGAATNLGAIGDGTGAIGGLTSADVPTRSPLRQSGEFAVGTDAGVQAAVNVYNADQSLRFSLTPYSTFTGGVRVASADFNNDGVSDILIGSGPGIVSNISLIDGKTQAVLTSIQPYETSFTGGVFVAVGDTTGDGIPELVVSPDLGGSSRVRVFNGSTFAQVDDFFGIEDPNFRGGARVAVGDLDGDGKGDVIVAAGVGGGPRVAVYTGASLGSGTLVKPFGDFFVFEQTLRNGVFVAAGDVNADGKADLIASGGPGGGPRVFALSGASLVAATSTQVPLANFFAGDVNSRGGVRVTTKNGNVGVPADILTASGTGDGSRIRSYDGTTLTAAAPPEEFAFDAFAGVTGGVFVG